MFCHRVQQELESIRFEQKNPDKQVRSDFFFFNHYFQLIIMHFSLNSTFIFNLHLLSTLFGTPVHLIIDYCFPVLRLPWAYSFVKSAIEIKSNLIEFCLWHDCWLR